MSVLYTHTLTGVDTRYQIREFFKNSSEVKFTGDYCGILEAEDEIYWDEHEITGHKVQIMEIVQTTTNTLTIESMSDDEDE